MIQVAPAAYRSSLSFPQKTDIKKVFKDTPYTSGKYAGQIESAGYSFGPPTQNAEVLSPKLSTFRSQMHVFVPRPRLLRSNQFDRLTFTFERHFSPAHAPESTPSIIRLTEIRRFDVVHGQKIDAHELSHSELPYDLDEAKIKAIAEELSQQFLREMRDAAKDFGAALVRLVQRPVPVRLVISLAHRPALAAGKLLPLKSGHSESGKTFKKLKTISQANPEVSDFYRSRPVQGWAEHPAGKRGVPLKGNPLKGDAVQGLITAASRYIRPPTQTRISLFEGKSISAPVDPLNPLRTSTKVMQAVPGVLGALSVLPSLMSPLESGLASLSCERVSKQVGHVYCRAGTCTQISHVQASSLPDQSGTVQVQGFNYDIEQLRTLGFWKASKIRLYFDRGGPLSTSEQKDWAHATEKSTAGQWPSKDQIFSAFDHARWPYGEGLNFGSGENFEFFWHELQSLVPVTPLHHEQLPCEGRQSS
ncbi:MAG: hypothetical protein EOP09_02725 [Proteobacteria bacterium]|nr:MAG: hypothetical protein EOP09_02725 [Pseudomonadota bacterium]